MDMITRSAQHQRQVVLPATDVFYFHSFIHHKQQEVIADFYNTISKLLLDNPVEENIKMFVKYMKMISDKDFSSLLQKIISMINKKYNKLTPSVYFKSVSLSLRSSNSLSKVFGYFFKPLFGQKKKKKRLLTSQIPLLAIDCTNDLRVLS